ncbi:MAG: response regulator [bacterium]
MNDQRLRALVIEDDPLIARLIQKILEIEGFEIEKAWNGTEGCARAKEVNFNLIVLDFHLPDIDGTKVLECLNACPRTQKTPILLTTAHVKMPFDPSQFGDRIMMFLEKPFERRHLVEKVREIVDSQDTCRTTPDPE